MTTDLVEAIESELGITREAAGELLVAARPLWKKMANLGMVDGWAGAECARVLPKMLSYARAEANKPPPKPRQRKKKEVTP